MGHMNVRFYVAKQMEGLAIMAPALGLSRSFRPRSSATLLPVTQHIRYMKEIRPGRPIYMVGGVLDWSEDEVTLYQELRHTISDAPAAAFRTRVRHVEAQTLKAFGWRDKTIAAFESLKVTPPDHTAPRSLDPDGPFLSREEAMKDVPDNLGVPVIGRGCVPAEHCDTHGRMQPEHFIGRVSDSVPNLLTSWREDVAAAAEKSGEKVEQGAAVLEYLLNYRSWPKAGDILEVQTGLGRVTPKVHSFVHWISNPVTGKVYCTSEAVAVTFDLNTRKVIEANPDHMKLLEERVPRGLKV